MVWRLGLSAASVTVTAVGVGVQPNDRWPSTPISATNGLTASALIMASVL